MSSSLPARRHLVLYALAVAVTVVVLLTTALARIAVAHGSVVDPASRNYSCWLRWGSDFQSPRMATEDPMCYQAWQADPNAMWNWNGLFRENVGGNHQAAIPDGQLCSAGHTQSGRYNAMDTVGAWNAQAIGNNFGVRLFDGASHGADYIRVYVTKQGFDPTTQSLGWGNLDLVSQIGNTPAAQWTPADGGVSITVNASAAGRTGRHMIYTIWQASHLDQSYYFCSDVTFSGGSSPSPSPSASPSPSPTASPTPTPTPSASISPTASPTPAPGACSAAYSTVGQWPGGFQGEVRVTAGAAAISRWTVALTFPNGQQIQNVWNATVTTSGSTATARNVSYNGSLGAGGSTTFGFLGSWTTVNGAPAVSCSVS